MNRLALLLAALGIFVVTASTDAAPRRWGGGGYGYGNGYYGNGYGYGNGYYGNGYYGNGYGYGGLGIGIGGYGGGVRVYSSPSYGNYYGNGYYGNGYYGNGYTSNYGGYGYGSYFPSNWYSASPWTTRNAVTTGQTQEVVPATYTESISSAAPWGLRIDEVTSGGAAQKADLRKGDVIVGVGKTRTESFEELAHALAVSKGTIEVTFLNTESQRMEKVRITPVDGKIGVSVVPVNLQ